MNKIVDRFGNLIDTGQLKESQTASVAWLNREFAQHPIKGLTPPKLAQLLEGAETGDMVAQCELAEDIEERDAHIFAELSKRKRAILTFDWSIEPPQNASAAEKAAAEAIQEQIQAIPDFEDVLLNMMDGLLKGFSCLEMEWKQGKTWEIKQLYHRDPSWFTVAPQDRNTLLLRSMIPNSELNVAAEPLQEFGWIAHIHKSKSGYLPRAGLVRVLAWLHLFKNYSVRDLAELLEIYGVPIGLGKYPPNANPQEKATLLNALVSIGHNARGIIPQGMDLSFLSEAKGNADGFQLMLEFCDRSASKAIVGGTLASDSSGGTKTNALGAVHERALLELVISDLRQLASTLTRDLVYPLQVLNTKIDPHRKLFFKFDTVDLTVDQIKIFKEIGWVFSLEFLSKKFQLPIAKPDEPTLDNPFPEQKTVAPPVAPPPVQPADQQTQPNQEQQQTALKTSLNQSDPLDQFVDDLTDDWRPVMTPVFDPIQEAFDKSTSWEELLANVAKTKKDMDSSKLAETLAKALFTTHVYGRVKNET
jgi:phage gp29-like protein